MPSSGLIRSGGAEDESQIREYKIPESQLFCCAICGGPLLYYFSELGFRLIESTVK